MLCLMGADGAEGYEEVLRSDRELQAVPGREVPLWAIHGHPALLCGRLPHHFARAQLTPTGEEFARKSW